MAKPVTIYSTQSCGFCRATKEYLTKHDISFKDIDVGKDSAKAREMIEKSGQMGVPVIIIGSGADEQLIVGFDQARLATALDINE